MANVEFAGSIPSYRAPKAVAISIG